MGASAFLGLNDFFTSANEYNDYASAQQNSATSALGLAGTLTFNIAGVDTLIAYAVGDSITDIRDTILANGLLAAANVNASVVTDGSGFRLRFNDADGDNFFVTDNTALLSTPNIKVRDPGVTRLLAVRSDIISDSSLISRGALASNAGLVAGQAGINPGEKTIVQAIANKFNEALGFDAAGLLPGGKMTMANYAANMVALNATQASSVKSTLMSRETLFENVRAKNTSQSGVNLDEEMAQMIVLENAYAASARVIMVTEKMFDLLSDLLR